MSVRACPEAYYPDEPFPEYEPEYTTPADTSWLDNYQAPPRINRMAKAAGVKVVRHRPLLAALPQTCIDRDGHDVFPDESKPFLPSIIRGGKPKTSGKTLSNPGEEQSTSLQSIPVQSTQPRRDGNCLVIECTAGLKHAVTIFKQDPDNEAILEIEAELNDAGRAINRLKKQARELWCKKMGAATMTVRRGRSQDDSESLVLPIFDLSDTEGIMAHMERIRKARFRDEE